MSGLFQKSCFKANKDFLSRPSYLSCFLNCTCCKFILISMYHYSICSFAYVSFGIVDIDHFRLVICKFLYYKIYFFRFN